MRGSRDWEGEEEEEEEEEQEEEEEGGLTVREEEERERGMLEKGTGEETGGGVFG